LDLSGIRSCCLQTGIFWLFLYLLVFLSFLLLALLLWLRIPVLCWVGVGGHPCLVPDFRGYGFSFSPLSMV
jgi:hypothetical protein